MKWFDSIHLDEQRVLSLLGSAVCVLVVLHLVAPRFSAGAFWMLADLFDLKGEQNIPTWFSSMLLAWTGLVAASCGQLEVVHPQRVTWRMIAGTLFLLSCDEVVMFHESLTRFVK